MKKYFISFGNGIFTKKVQLLKKQAIDTGWFDNVIIENPETISSFINEHSDHFKHNRGYGYWLWKPYIILKQLELINENDLLFYTDAGATILPHKEYRFNEYVNTLSKSDTPILTFPLIGHTERMYQKRFTLEKYNLVNHNDFLNSNMIESGVLCLRKCEYSVRIVKEWLDTLIMKNYIYSTNELIYETQDESFIDYRHDQSILSIICKFNNSHQLLEEAYGLGPFFSSRKTDDGTREFAPDFFRASPDYIHHRHRFIKDWLADKPSGWWKDEDDYNPKMHLSESDYVTMLWNKWNDKI